MTAPLPVPRALAVLRRDIEALDFSPYDSIEATPRELSDRLVDLSDEMAFALNTAEEEES